VTYNLKVKGVIDLKRWRSAQISSTSIAGHTLHVTRHTSHVTPHTSQLTRHRSPCGACRQFMAEFGEGLGFSACCQTSNITRHTSHVTRHTSHVTRHTSHVTRHSGNYHVIMCSPDRTCPPPPPPHFKPFPNPQNIFSYVPH